MYSTCLFCHSDLGQNESIEHFPVGRRLAFDAARGRLWVVCRNCERWNLTPIDARWEAIEECERLFRDTRLRVSTDNIGLARLPEGLELVRIGQPQRPEMAGWRYGDQFGRRRRRYLTYTAGGAALATSIAILGPASGIISIGAMALFNLVAMGDANYIRRRVRARLRLPNVETMAELRLEQLRRVSVIGIEGSWGLQLPFEAPTPLQERVERQWLFPIREARAEHSTTLAGDEAIRVARTILPALNESGARRSEVKGAVQLMDGVQDSRSLFERYAGRPGETGHTLSNLPKDVLLALEMATHEESERRALEGELAILEAAWKEAEEIAAIADDLLVPDDAKRRLTALKRGDDTR
jgi:hypothetical protein